MITAYPKQAIVNRQIQTLVQQEIDRQRTEREIATAKRLAEQERKIRELEDRLHSKTQRVNVLSAQLVDAIPYTHPDPEPGSLLGDLFWGVLGLTILGWGRLWDWLTARDYV